MLNVFHAAWESLVAQLSKKHPPQGEVKPVQVMKELEDEDSWGNKYYNQNQFEQEINPVLKPRAEENIKKGMLVENKNLLIRQEEPNMNNNINKSIAEEIDRPF